jgi:hypothetical protein
MAASVSEPSTEKHGVAPLLTFVSKDSPGGPRIARLPIPYRADRDGVRMQFDRDQEGRIYLNVGISPVISWRPVPAEKAYQEQFGHSAISQEELQDWIKKSHYNSYSPPLEDGHRLFNQWLRSQNTTHPGFEPHRRYEKWGFVISRDGEVISHQQGFVKPSTSCFLPPLALTREEFNWFEKNVMLPAQSSFNIGFSTVLGIDTKGNRVYLMSVDVPFKRESSGMGSEHQCTVYYVSPEKKISFSHTADCSVRMDSSSRMLYEMHPEFEDGSEYTSERTDEPRAWRIRVWQ